MQHQPAAHEPRRVCEAVREAGRRGEQQEPRCPDSVGGQHDECGLLEVFPSVPVDVVGTSRPPAAVERDLSHACARDESRFAAKRIRPVSEVGRRLRAGRTAALAHRAPLALRQPSVGSRGDRVRAGPPVPPETVHSLRSLPAHLADRVRRQRRRRPRWVRRVAAEPRDTHLDVDPLVVRQELLVGERPVVGHPVQRAHAEIRRDEPRPDRRVVNRAAADRVEHERPDLGRGHLARVVLGKRTDVRVRVPRFRQHELPGRALVREV